MSKKQLSKEEEFAFETRSVILNFMNLFPSHDINLSDSYTSSSSGSDRHRTVKKTISLNSDRFYSFDSQHSKEEGSYFSSLDGSDDRQKILTHSEDAVEGPGHGSNLRLRRQIATDLPILDKPEEQAFKSTDLPLIPLEKPLRSASPRRPDTLNIVPDVPDLSPSWESKHVKLYAQIGDGSGTKRDRRRTVSSDNDDIDAARVHTNHGRVSVPDGRLSRQDEHDATTGAVNRQASRISTISTDLGSSSDSLRTSRQSHASSSRVSLAGIKEIDLQNLVKTNTLPQVVVPLKEELSKEFEQMERCYGKCKYL